MLLRLDLESKDNAVIGAIPLEQQKFFAQKQRIFENDILKKYVSQNYLN